MFRGINAANLDSKGRVLLPSRHRLIAQSRCNGELVVTIDTEERCLLLYPQPDWEAIEAKLEALPSFDPLARRIQRLLIGHATDLEMDTSGRVLIPPLLREYAGLTKKVQFVGQGKKIELWDEGHWLQKREEWLQPKDNGQLSQSLDSLSL